MIATNTIRLEPHYRRAAFDAGLRRIGYTLVSDGAPRDTRDLLVIWNRQGEFERRATLWESQGGTVIVCENGYLGRDAEDRQFYAISRGGHNGSGWFPDSAEDRFAMLGIDLAPWRSGGDYVLVCGQRGIGSRLMASPPAWDTKTAVALKRADIKVRVRPHPGRYPPATTLDADLAGASSCVIWSSASGVKALTLGIPVAYTAPHWICAEAAGNRLDGVNKPLRDDDKRLAAMRHMASGQWAVAEIESGEPFARIMGQPGASQ